MSGTVPREKEKAMDELKLVFANGPGNIPACAITTWESPEPAISMSVGNSGTITPSCLK
jgi:hypothetical protein